MPTPLSPIRPNAGLQVKYERCLERAIDEMVTDVSRELLATYRTEQPDADVAMDAISPARRLRTEMRRLSRRWVSRFDRLAPQIGDWFAQKAADRVDSQLKSMLREAGFTVRFTTTPAQRNALDAIVAENVALIKSIPQQYMLGVEGDVMRSVVSGRDLKTLTDALEATGSVTRRRAARIALDQANKATANLARVRMIEAGITEARWLHSGGSNEPRPEHVAFSGKTYDVRKGAFLEGEWVWPGTAINCKCVAIPILPGFE